MKETPWQYLSISSGARREGPPVEQLIFEHDQRHWTEGLFESAGIEYKSGTILKDKSSAFLLSALEQTTEGIVVVDLEGNLISLNEAFANIHGHSPRELIGEHISLLHTPEQMPSVEAANQQVRETGEFTGEIWHVQHDGTVFPTLMYNSLLKDKDGNPIGIVGVIRDITGQKGAEEALQQSEERYRLLVDNLDHSLTVHDSEGNISFINSKGAMKLGILPGDVIGRSLHDFLPDTSDIYVDRARQIFKLGRGFEFEDEFTHSAGKRWFYSNLQPVKGKDGAVVAVQAISYDITERKEAEHALRESEERYRTIFETVPASIIVLDKDGQIIDINPNHVARVAKNRVAKEDFIGKDIVTHPTVVNAGLTESYKGLLAGESFEEQNVYFPTLLAGVDGYFNVKGVPVCKNGDVIGAIVIHEDITEYRKAEEKLRKRNEELTALNAISETIAHSANLDEILSNTMDMVLKILDIKTGCIYLKDKNGEYLQLSIYRGISDDLVQELSSIRVGDNTVGKAAQTGEPLYIKSLSDAIEKMTEKAKENALRQELESGMFVPLKTKFGIYGVMTAYTSKNRTFTSEERKLLLTIGHQIGTAIESAGLMEDASRTRALEEIEELRAALLANVSHELRTPLTCIKGLASSLIQPDIIWDEEIQKDFLETINKEADKLTIIISDLLNMSQLESGRMELYKVKTTVLSILDQIKEQVRTHLNNHQFVASISPDMPEVYADEVRIGEVIINLIANAAAYSDEGTSITVEAGEIDGEVVVSVIDEGIGIPEEDILNVFDRFSRLENGAKRRRSGTGLGLSICRGIIEKHGCRIWAESEVGKGSKFSFSLPNGAVPAEKG